MSRLYIPCEVYLLTAEEFTTTVWPTSGEESPLVMNSSREKAWAQGWVDALGKAALTYSRLEGIASNPTVDDLLRNLHQVPKRRGVIVAVGGGRELTWPKHYAL